VLVQSAAGHRGQANAWILGSSAAWGVEVRRERVKTRAGTPGSAGLATVDELPSQDRIPASVGMSREAVGRADRATAPGQLLALADPGRLMPA